jgi:hypothetical protein
MVLDNTATIEIFVVARGGGVVVENGRESVRSGE